MYQLKRMEGKHALVTGGLGFIGSNLARKLASLGCNVTAYDACLDPYGWNEKNVEGVPGIKFVKGDVRDAEEVEKVVSGADYIFHCAAQVSHTQSMKDPFLDLDVNAGGTLCLLEACRRKAENATLVYAGTCGQIGKMEYSPIDEKHPTDPMDAYGISKLAGEKYCLLYKSAYSLKTCSVRLSYNYGPRQKVRAPDYGILNYFIRMALEGKEITVFEPGDQLRDYNYVDDSVEAMILCAQNPLATGQIFLLGSGKPIKFVDMVQKVVSAVGNASFRMVPWPPERKAIEKGDYYVSFNKINKVLGWEPKTSFEEGLKKTVEFYRAHLKDYV
jgi:nucleoside-diphosphate-sugar epimerase